MNKIAFLTERLKSGFGVDLVVHEQATRLAQTHEAAVFAVEIDPKFVKNAKYAVHHTPIPLFFNPLKQDYSSWKYFKRYLTQLSRFDKFIINTPTFNAWIPNLSKMGQVYVQYFGNSPSKDYSGLKRYRKNIFDFTETQYYFRYPKKIISISSFLKNTFPPGIQAKTIPVPLAADHISDQYIKISKNERREILENYFIKPEEKLITYVGRLSYLENPYKNTYDLIRLRQSIDRKQFPNVKILAIGLPQNQIEREFFKHGVAVVPQATNIELAVLLARSHLYFSPSLWEGFNLPLLEAQTLGVPVVAYRVGAHEEVMRDQRTGFLVNSYDEAVECIRDLLTNPGKHKKLSVNATHWAQRFTWDKNVEALEKVIWS